MAEETTQAASSPADVFNGETPTLDEFNRYRETGEVPERFKPAEPADPAPADDQEETDPEAEEPEPESESEPEDTQELTPKAKKRIAQLLAERHELRQKLEQATKKDAPADPSPAPELSSKPTIDDKKPDGSPKYPEYEDYIAAVARWAAKEERTKWEQEFQQKEAQKALQATLDEARSRYEDADDVIFPAAEKIRDAKIPNAVKEVFGASEVFPDLCYVVGSDPEELEKFIALAQRNPRAAIGKVFEYERGIREEFARPRDEKGQFAPERKTAAPKPPAPVNGAATRAFDVNDESLSPEEWMRKRNAQLARA